MKSLRVVTISVAVLSVAGLMLALLLPGTTQAAQDVVQFRREGVQAEFQSVDGSGCIFTSVFVLASKEFVRYPPGPKSTTPFAQIGINQYDSCTDTVLMTASGFSTLAAADLLVGGKLESAKLTATINVFDYVSGSPFDVFVDLSWTATGPVVRENLHDNFHSHDFTFNLHSNGTNRPATASGSVSAGATNFAPNPSVGASIFSAKAGEVVISRNPSPSPT